MPLIGRHALAAATIVGTCFAVTVLRAAVMVTRQFWRSIALRRQLDQLKVVMHLLPMPTQSSPRRVAVVDVPERYCFTYGLICPTIVLSTGALNALTAVELDAVLAHESTHQRRRSPLRFLVSAAAVRALFFVPVLTDLYKGARIAEELEADRVAAELHGGTELLSALRVFAGSTIPRLSRPVLK